MSNLQKCDLCSETDCGDDEYCSGCNSYVCAGCCESYPFGAHSAADHTEPEEDAE